MGDCSLTTNLNCCLSSDCLDGGDEVNCPGRLAGSNTTCKSSEFTCRERPYCVEATWVCDGDKVRVRETVKVGKIKNGWEFSSCGRVKTIVIFHS